MLSSHQCFAAGSAAEIWAEYEPKLRNPLRPQAFLVRCCRTPPVA